MEKHGPNVALKAAMFATGKKQQQIARAARISPQKLTHVLYGRRVFTAAERRRLAKVLHQDEAALFASEAVAS